MIINRLSAEGDTAAARYSLLTESWRSLFLNALNDADFGSAAQAIRVSQDAYRLAEVFLAEERLAAERVFEDIATEAHQTTIKEIESIDASELTAQTLEHLRVTQSYIDSELVAQIHRDIALVRDSLQRVVLEVSLASRSRGISSRQALIEYRIGNAKELSFVFQDRQTRRWSSKKYVRALWRHTLLAVYNETVMMTLADHGLDRAMVVHQDADAQSHGMIVTFGSSSDLPTYSEIRATVFHPNANAWLEMEKTNVSA